MLIRTVFVNPVTYNYITLHDITILLSMKYYFIFYLNYTASRGQYQSAIVSHLSYLQIYHKTILNEILMKYVIILNTC